MNKIITLRKFEDSDLPLFQKWLYLPHVAAWYHDPLDWLDEVKNRKDKFAFLHHFMVEQGVSSCSRSQRTKPPAERCSPVALHMTQRMKFM